MLGPGAADRGTNQPTIRSFESQLWEIRNTRGITFEEIAERLNVSGPYISQILRRGPGLDQVERIAKVLKLPPQHFDVYHVLTLERDVRAGNPLAHQYVQLMARVAQLPDSRRQPVMTEAVRRAEPDRRVNRPAHLSVPSFEDKGYQRMRRAYRESRVASSQFVLAF